MINDIIKLLKIIDTTDNVYINIAKGRNKYPSNFKEIRKNIKLGVYKNNKAKK